MRISMTQYTFKPIASRALELDEYIIVRYLTHGRTYQANKIYEHSFVPYPSLIYQQVSIHPSLDTCNYKKNIDIYMEYREVENLKLAAILDIGLRHDIIEKVT
jgi:hypothetical protein